MRNLTQIKYVSVAFISLVISFVLIYFQCGCSCLPSQQLVDNTTDSACTESAIKITHYPNPRSTQIWIDSADYDSRSRFNDGEYHFIKDNKVNGTLSGTAYYFAPYDGPGTYQPWWVEYSINTSSLGGVKLTNKKWYFWARVYQPLPCTEDSDLIFVKDDPSDGSGKNWYDKSLATADSSDIIFNNLSAAGPADTWVWSSTENSPLVSKEFRGNKSIVFRISERESGLTNARIDVILWTDNPDYVPSYEDYPGF